MKKIKFLIASMLGAIALVFACVLGTRVNAATLLYPLTVYNNNNYTLTDSMYSWDVTVTSNDKINACFCGDWSYKNAGANGRVAGMYPGGKSKSDRYFKVTLLEGYKLRSFVISGDNKTNTRDIGLGTSIFSTISTDNILSGTQVVTTSATETVDMELVSAENGIEISSTNKILYLNFSEKFVLNKVLITLSKEDTSSKYVSFYVDGAQIDSKPISSGQVEMPTNPVKQGYDFSGWLLADGTSFSNENLNQDINVYANFTKNSLDKTFVGTPVAFEATAGDKTADIVINSNFTIKASSDKKVTVSSLSKTTDIEDGSFTNVFKFGGDGSKSSRCLEITLNTPSRVVVYAVASSKDEVAPYVIVDSDGNELLSGELPASSTPSTIIFDATTSGTFYLYGKRVNKNSEGKVYEKTLNIYGAKVADSYYKPNLSLSVDAKTELSKVRVVATIDNVDIDSSKVNGISSVVYTVYGETKTTNLPAAKLYTSIDFTDKGFYSQKNYTAYAVMVFSGYNSTNVTAAFDVKVTVTLSNDVVVEKTISVPAPAAPSNN